jgi:hypothetical protein
MRQEIKKSRGATSTWRFTCTPRTIGNTNQEIEGKPRPSAPPPQGHQAAAAAAASPGVVLLWQEERGRCSSSSTTLRRPEKATSAGGGEVAGVAAFGRRCKPIFALFHSWVRKERERERDRRVAWAGVNLFSLCCASPPGMMNLSRRSRWRDKVGPFTGHASSSQRRRPPWHPLSRAVHVARLSGVVTPGVLARTKGLPSGIYFMEWLLLKY